MVARRAWLSLLIWGASMMASGAAEHVLYIGTYTGETSQGIYRMRFDSNSGTLTLDGLAAETENPSFLAIHPDRLHLYAVNELSELRGEATGGVSAFEIQQDGNLKFLNQQPSRGTSPCHLVVDQTQKYVLLTNYSSGSTVGLAIDEDGSLGRRTAFLQHEGSSVDPQRQESPHAHSINLDQANHFAVVADLGTDELLIYEFNPEDGALTPHTKTKLASGAGPRHFVFHPNGKLAYAINEMNSTVTALRYDATAGTLTPLQSISTLPTGFQGSTSTAEIRITPDGKFVYGSNRGHDSIVVFQADEQGALTLVEIKKLKGKTPRNFQLDPTAQFLLAAGQDSNTIEVFRIDSESGKLSAVGEPVAVPRPVCIRFMP